MLRLLCILSQKYVSKYILCAIFEVTILVKATKVDSHEIFMSPYSLYIFINCAYNAGGPHGKVGLSPDFPQV